MKKTVKWIFGLVVVAAVGMQFFNPSLTNPPVEPGADLMATNPPPPEVAALLHHACYDCHSYETKWPWYSHVAPASWFLVNHINDGRGAMNFSDWPHDDPSTARATLKVISRQLESGRMPLKSYTLIHPLARLTPAQRKQLADWAAQTAASLKD